MESMAHQERAEMAVQTERVVLMEHRALQEKMVTLVLRVAMELQALRGFAVLQVRAV